jgi:hypothetical protein
MVSVFETLQHTPSVSFFITGSFNFKVINKKNKLADDK